jgi:hypothetical protein
MPVIAKIQDKTPPKEEIHFPCVMISKDRTTILLVKEKSEDGYEGTSLYDGTFTIGIGYHSKTWEESLFSPFFGSITLLNGK